MIDTSKPTVAIQDGRAFYELTAQQILCAVDVPHGGRTYPLLVALKPAKAERMIDFLNQRNFKRKPSKEKPGASEFEVGAPELYNDLIDEHLIEASVRGKVLTSQELDHIAAQHPIKIRLYDLAYGSFFQPLDEDDEDISALFSDNVSIPLYVEHCDAGGKERRIDIKHILRAPTAKESMHFGRSSKGLLLKDGSITAAVNNAAQVSMYDDLVQFAEGLLIDGIACEPGNKDKWLSLVPIAQKIMALDKLFGSAERKNA